MKIIKLNNLDHPEVKRMTDRQGTPSAQAGTIVKNILIQVRSRGHKAVEAYAKKFDGLKGQLKLTKQELNAQAEKCPKPLRTSFNKAILNVTTFHNAQTESSWKQKNPGGVILGQTIRPLNRVGVYVPGGAGVYPSTVIMNVVPALVAGVKEIVAVTPVSGKIDPTLAYVLKKLNISEIYKIGGAQAIAMLAYGTEKVKRVDKIVGPGNNFVALAKKEVFGIVDIDMIAGPSEILVMADESSDPDWVAADLLSQAEHGSGYEAAVCITTSEKTALFISECVKLQVANSPRKEIVQKSLRRFGRIFVVKDWEKGIDLANNLAPEHLEMMMTGAEKLADKIHSAGAVFVGPYSAEPVGDYFAGPNHVLPTNGSARFFSPLGVYDFYKRSSYIQYSRQAMIENGKHIAAMADSEGFFHHAESIRKRL
ncbi:MAG: histidinol dehydrogenase [Fibrobacteria bacterium]|nr:histidinol dehydrogenase [Fibrobacteria bacterium]